MDFEDRFLHNIDTKRARDRRERTHAEREHLELPPAIEKAHQRARKMFSDPHYAIQATEFLQKTEDGVEKGVYTKEQIIADMQEVKRLEQIFTKENSIENKHTKVYADVLEAIILEQSELGNWFGEDVTTLKTSRYDDYKNKTDMLAQWNAHEGTERVLGLAVDITFSSKKSSEKFEGIKREIKRDELGSIRYFRNDDSTFMGRRENVPRVVIGVEKKMILELAELWVQNDKRKLQEHPVQYLLVNEITQQTKNLLAYAMDVKAEKAAREYRRVLRVIRDIAESRKPQQHESLPLDRVYESITRVA